ncbi:hypothetical protein BKA70DRAFT_1440890 [Coprinopsis sp. MPI-PUGE-AT-0042]|nr:hypothetical protein BKA70DRAFT_1440890 [Coprinopsis sp. MPI-PUGE-AT-0042]
MDAIEMFLSKNKVAGLHGEMFMEHPCVQNYFVHEAPLSKKVIESTSAWNEEVVSAPNVNNAGNAIGPKRILMKGCLYSTGDKTPQIVSLLAYEPIRDKIDGAHCIDLRWIFPNGAMSARVCNIYGLDASAPVQHHIFFSSHLVPAPRNAAVQEQCGQGWLGNVLWLRYCNRREYALVNDAEGIKAIWCLPSRYDRLQHYQINETKLLGASFFKELSALGLYRALEKDSSAGMEGEEHA